MNRVPSHAIYEKSSERNICNICLKSATLTLDHVPPKAALPVRQVHVKPLFNRADRSVFSQSGVKYRTLCVTCNRDRLGQSFDKALIAMCKQASRLHRNSALLVQQPTVEIDPGQVLRSVLGHMLAAKDHTPRTKADEQMRAFFMDPASTDLGDLHVFYWAHPDRSIRMMRDTAVLEFGSSIEVVWCDLLVWYPIGFLVCDKLAYEMSCMNDYLGKPYPTLVPLRALASGVLERWFNRTGKVIGEPGESAFLAEHSCRPPSNRLVPRSE